VVEEIADPEAIESYRNRLREIEDEIATLKERCEQARARRRRSKSIFLNAVRSHANAYTRPPMISDN